MYSIKVEMSFSAAHNLRGYKGKCESLHGHNWKIEAVAQSRELDRSGMVMDFHDIRSELSRVLEKFDHKYLNKVKPFDKTNPTSENIACFIYGELKARISGLKAVTVWENPGSCATYYE